MLTDFEVFVLRKPFLADRQLVRREKRMPADVVVDHCFHRQIETTAFPERCISL